ncbi:type II secretion system F family protein [Halobellus rarus]|uniref:Type II secretion system F family protein n=1 Tax=Halobellus rarus TaxID=1126237 RepID=A0ABD6CHY0_9EURY|nr:type II secretion system F family protein [Halobellus rarus]
MPHADRSLGPLDRAAYALFASRADSRRHERDRRAYRGTNVTVAFDLYVARVYALSWALALLVACVVVGIGLLLPTGVVEATAAAALERIGRFGGEASGPAVPERIVLSRTEVAAAVGVVGALVAAGVHLVVVYAAGRYLRWLSAARRANIGRTLPSAVRYLNVLASGSDGRRAMLRRVADTDAYGETAVALRKALNTAAMTGNVDEGLRRVARDTPAQDSLAPFLLKFREHADQGSNALREYLSMESRMLRHQQDRDRQRAAGFLELLAELFVVLLVLPALLVIVLTVMSIVAPGLSAPVRTPFGSVTLRALVVYGSAAFILLVGGATAALVSRLRPPDQHVVYRRPASTLDSLRTATRNPASAAVAFAPIGIAAFVAAVSLGVDTVVSLLVGYVGFSIPVGIVAVRRARLDDAKDHELKDFVHAVSGHVNLGRPFSAAVDHVARDVDLGPLNRDVADLSMNLHLTTPGDAETDLRTAALDRFVERVGTPMAEQTVGLVIGALDAGSDTGVVFETLQGEVGRLYHEKRALRSGMLVYVAVGWTTALLVIGISVATSANVFAGFDRLSTMSELSGVAVDPGAVDLARDQYRVYVTTQATMLAAGWFSGVASRGQYEALLHSGCLVAVCHVVFTGMGLV